MKFLIIFSICILCSFSSNPDRFQETLKSLKSGMKKEKVDEFLKSQHSDLQIKKSPWNNSKDLKKGHWFFYSLKSGEYVHISFTSEKQSDGTHIYYLDSIGKAGKDL